MQGLTITFDAVVTKYEKRNNRPQKRFGEAHLVAYALIDVNSDGAACELDDFIICGDSSKFGAQGNFANKQ